MATFYAFSFFMLVALTNANHNITSPPITDWGVWGQFQRCPFGRYAQGFQLKTEPNQYLGDDTALNSIRLFCGDPYRPDTAAIKSTEGQFGEWGNVYTCYPGVLTAFQLRVESNRGSGDDTATNNARFWCSTSSNPNEYIEGDGMSWGDWSSAQHCYGGQAICGIQTQVEPYMGDDGDDTMLNNVKMECCDYQASKLEADYIRVKQLANNQPTIFSPRVARFLKASNVNHEAPANINLTSLVRSVSQIIKKEVESAEKEKITHKLHSADFTDLVKSVAGVLKTIAVESKEAQKNKPTVDLAGLTKETAQVLHQVDQENAAKTNSNPVNMVTLIKEVASVLRKVQVDASSKNAIQEEDKIKDMPALIKEMSKHLLQKH